MTTSSDNAPDRMTTVAEFQQRAGSDQARTTAILSAMGQGMMGALAEVAKQAQLPPAEAVKAGFIACLQAARSIGQQAGKSQQEVASTLDKMFNLGLNSGELHSRLGKRALELLARGLNQTVAMPDLLEEARGLVDEAQSTNGHGPHDPAPSPVEDEVIVCGARLPRAGARCTLAPHADGGHVDHSIGVNWEPGDA